MRAYLCELCGRVYTPNRPNLCECNTNVFLKEYWATPEELEKLKEEGVTIIDFVGKNMVGLLEAK